MKVLITGGAGFIGSQLGHYLHKLGYKVVLLDNLSFGYKDNLTINNETFGEFILNDIRSDSFINYLKDVDTVFHLAGIAPLPINQIDPCNAYNNNVAGTANVLEACRKAKVSKIIFASTSAVYENNIKFPFEENDKINPTLIYSLTKKHAEELVQSYIKSYDMDITTLRFFNVYGPHHDFRRKSPPLIAYIIKCLMTNEVPLLHSDGLQKRDYVNVADVCRMCQVAMTRIASKNQTFNVASNSVISMNEIYNKISTIMKSDIKPKFRDPKLLWDKYTSLTEGFAIDESLITKETNKFSQGSYDKAKQLLNWEPKISFDDGILETVNHAIKSGL
jgi:nucleoside-diphosphate-sugar epimerase